MGYIQGGFPSEHFTWEFLLPGCFWAAEKMPLSPVCAVAWLLTLLPQSSLSHLALVLSLEVKAARNSLMPECFSNATSRRPAIVTPRESEVMVALLSSSFSPCQALRISSESKCCSPMYLIPAGRKAGWEDMKR